MKEGKTSLISQQRQDNNTRVVNQYQQEGRVIDVRELPQYEVKRSTYYTDNAQIQLNQLPAKEIRPSVGQQRIDKTVNINVERADVEEVVVEKHFTVQIEKPVPVYREVEVPYDVIVEKPVEKLVKRDVVTEVVMEKPVEKVIEV